MALEIEARHAAQLHRHAQGDDAEPVAQEQRIGALEIERRHDAEQVELRRQPAGDAPEIGEAKARQGLILRRFIQQQHSPPVFLILLGDVIGDLGQRLGRRDADRDRNAGPLQHRGAQRAGVRFEARCAESLSTMPRKASSIE